MLGQAQSGNWLTGLESPECPPSPFSLGPGTSLCILRPHPQGPPHPSQPGAFSTGRQLSKQTPAAILTASAGSLRPWMLASTLRSKQEPLLPAS